MKPTASFSILARSFPGGPRPRNAALILGGLWLTLFFLALFSPPLLDDADATHAQAARAMASTGDLVTLHVDGIRYLEKAPLPYWLVALSFRIFGFNTFAAHLPQALAVALLALIAHRWANQAFGARTAFYTAVAILTSIGVFLFTRIFIPEVWLSLFLATSLFAFIKSLHPELQPAAGSGGPPSPTALPSAQVGFHHIPIADPTEQPSVAWYAGPHFYPYILWTTLALAVLTKGLVAVIFFFGTAILYFALTGDHRHLGRTKPLTGVLLFLAIAAPWHLLAGLRNTGGMDGHGFFWFYFVNEHVLRFLGRRIPRDYNKLPTSLFWLQHLVWLFPWSLFFPLLTAQSLRSFQASRREHHVDLKGFAWLIFGGVFLGTSLEEFLHINFNLSMFAIFIFILIYELHQRRKLFFPGLPLVRTTTFQQRTTLLLTLFAALILLFFSISTNQEYYTFPAYLPMLLLTCAAITRAEQTYAADPSARRWITFAHAAFTVLGMAVAAALTYGLWASRHLPFVPDIGALLAHRAVGDYTLSMSHLFDLTGPSFAALRLPATIALFAFATGPAIAWTLRQQRRHLAATTTIAFTSALFLAAAHIALDRFAPMLSSHDMAQKIEQLQRDRRIAPDRQVLLFGDQSYGSSIPFYLGEQVFLVDGRTTSMLFGSTFPDAPPIFLSPADLFRNWGTGPRKILFVPLEKRDEVDHLLGSRQILLEETSGKALITDRPLDR
jgi:4-amino-4-deoxy-L-arabinose transferase-like glycosyltransferase